jgi:RNA polymerase sigma factor (sigma-70 family)
LGAWRRWQRENQVIDLLPMVDRIARNVKWMFAPYLDFRDLTQAGSVGLVHAANSYHPAKGAFEPYAWFRVRGAIIDSQKRRVYREESNVSLQGMAEAHDGWLPPALDTDPAPLADEIAEREEIHRMLTDAIAGLPDLEQRVLRGHLDGESLAVTAKQMGRSLTWTRAKLAEAREQVGAVVRGEVA